MFGKRYNEISYKHNNMVIEDQNKTIQDILEIVTFIRDNAVSKDEFNEFGTEVKKEMNGLKTELQQEIKQVKTELQQEIKEVKFELKQESSQIKTELQQEIREVREEIVNHVDGFIGLHKKTDTVVTALRSKTSRLEEKQDSIIRQLKLQIS